MKYSKEYDMLYLLQSCRRSQSFITVFLPEIEAPLKELSMSMQLGWVKN